MFRYRDPQLQVVKNNCIYNLNQNIDANLSNVSCLKEKSKRRKTVIDVIGSMFELISLTLIMLMLLGLYMILTLVLPGPYISVFKQMADQIY